MPNKISVVGFREAAALVAEAARLLKAVPHLAVETKYPAGEIAVRGPARPGARAVVAMDINADPASLFRAVLLALALRQAGAKRVDLLAPWIAYGRQDRAVEKGESPAGLAVAQILSDNFDRVVTLDAHSPIFIKAFKNKLINVLPTVDDLPVGGQVVAAPDHGAIGRAKHAAKLLGLPVVLLQKKRLGHRVTGTISKGAELVADKKILLVDDMADSGQTLMAAAERLKRAGAAEVLVYVTHAFDAIKLRHRLAPWTSQVKTAFDHATNQVSQAAMAALAEQIKI